MTDPSTFSKEFDEIADLADTAGPSTPISDELLARIFEKIAALRANRAKQEDLLKLLEQTLVFQRSPPRTAVASHQVRMHKCTRCEKALSPGESVYHVSGRYWHTWRCA